MHASNRNLYWQLTWNFVFSSCEAECVNASTHYDINNRSLQQTVWTSKHVHYDDSSMTVAFWIIFLKTGTFSNSPKSNTFANHEGYMKCSRDFPKPRKLTCAWNSARNGQADDKMRGKNVFRKLLWVYKYVNRRPLSLHEVLFVRYLQIQWEYGKREREDGWHCDFLGMYQWSESWPSTAPNIHIYTYVTFKSKKRYVGLSLYNSPTVEISCCVTNNSMPIGMWPGSRQ